MTGSRVQDLFGAQVTLPATVRVSVSGSLEAHLLISIFLALAKTSGSIILSITWLARQSLIDCGSSHATLRRHRISGGRLNF